MKTKQSALLILSAGSDVQSGGLDLQITGLRKIRKSDILDFRQIKYKAEVAQVVTVGAVTASFVPVANTRYAISLGNITSKREGYSGDKRTYGYKTPAVITTLGANAALQREAINLLIIAQINGDSTNHVAAVTLTGGNGFTITDDAGYYPANLNGGSGGRKGATEAFAITNEDGSGWAAVNVVTTTDAVYAFGEGLRLSQDAPIIAPYSQGLISGALDAPVDFTNGTARYAVALQHYDAFSISTLGIAPSNAIMDGMAHVIDDQVIFVDNGTGTATTNLAGFVEFEREMLRNLFTTVYGSNQKSVLHFFDKAFIMQADTGVTPYTGTLAGTADVLDVFISPDGSLNHTNIGTQTIFSPVLDATGLLIDQDDTAAEGAHYSANQQTLGVQEFIVGKEEFSVNVRVVAADWTNTHFIAGFRKKEVYGANYATAYNDLAAIGTRASGVNDVVATQGVLTGAALVETVSTTAISTDTVSVDLEVRVDINGLVSCYANNVKYPVYSAGTTALILTAGLHMIPFFQHVNINSANAGVSISKFVAVPDKDWRIV